MTNYNERLDEILLSHGAEQGEFHYSLKSAILDWHNKQVEELLDRLLKHGEDFTTFGDGSRSVAVEYIKAERNKLEAEL